MSDKLRQKGKEFAQFMENLSQEEKRKGNDINFNNAKAEYKEFKTAYAEGFCYLCKKSLKSFSKESPCIHWLLKPNVFKKKNLPAVADKYGYFQIQSLLRWYANEEAFAKNINDLKDEGTGTKFFEVTIKYKNLEWSFSCAESDYLGHQNSKHAKHPHYHFQMRVDKRPFINFNDFHLPFSEMDVINIEAMKSKPNLVKQRFSFGEGMNEVLDSKEVIEHVLTNASSEGKYDESPFKFDSFAFAKEGKSINGDDLYKIIQEAKEKGVTVASLLHKLPNAKTQVVVSPGPGVVEQAPRSGGKNKNRT